LTPPPREPKVYRWTPEGVVDEAAPSTPPEVPKTAATAPKEPAVKEKRFSASSAEARKQENARNERLRIERKQKALAKSKREAEERLAKLRKQQEVNCNG